MKYHAIVSAHIYRNEDKSTDIEIYNQIDNDNNTTGIFDDIDHALLDQVVPEFDESGSYFFMAVVESEFVRYESYEGVEYDTEHEVKVITCLADLPKDTESKEVNNHELKVPCMVFVSLTTGC